MGDAETGFLWPETPHESSATVAQYARFLMMKRWIDERNIVGWSYLYLDVDAVSKTI